MTDTQHALFNVTWLGHCDVCDDRLRLARPSGERTDRLAWQHVINEWIREHGDGHGNACHSYFDTAPSTIPGPPAVHHSDALILPCIYISDLDYRDDLPLGEFPAAPDVDPDTAA